MKRLTAALALCLSLTGLGQSAEKTSGDAKPTASKGGGDAAASTEKSAGTTTDGGLKRGHKMTPHAASAPAAPKSSTDATVK